MKKFIAIILSISLLFLFGCKDSKKEVQNGKPTVYTSFYPIYDMTNRIAKDKINLISFMPEDKEAHYWEPSAKDMKDLDGSDLLIINGANMEPWENKIKSSVPDLKILNLSKGLDLIKSDGSAKEGEYSFIGSLDLAKEKYILDFGHTHEKIFKIGFYKLNGKIDNSEIEKIGKKIMKNKADLVKQKETFDVKSEKVYDLEMAHEHGEIFFNIPEEGRWIVFADRVSSDGLSYVFVDKNDDIIKPEVIKERKDEEKASFDPHSWISLKNAKSYIEKITDELSELSPENKEYFNSNKDEYIEEIESLEKEYEEKFKKTRIKHFVVPHQAYAYLCKDFGLKQYPLQGLTSMEEPSLKKIQESIEFCKDKDIKVVFYEYGGSKKGAESIAKEINGELKPLSTMEFVAEEQKKKDQHYIDLMRMNLENIYESIK
ncbi:MAG: zinc ABC transporter substrate-binding protein [Andreesenia angusta]|nr:zinc ABC transporter substrate-binding protein [Andreesenia angusta]